MLAVFGTCCKTVQPSHDAPLRLQEQIQARWSCKGGLRVSVPLASLCSRLDAIINIVAIDLAIYSRSQGFQLDCLPVAVVAVAEKPARQSSSLRLRISLV